MNKTMRKKTKTEIIRDIWIPNNARIIKQTKPRVKRKSYIDENGKAVEYLERSYTTTIQF